MEKFSRTFNYKGLKLKYATVRQVNGIMKQVPIRKWLILKDSRPPTPKEVMERMNIIIEENGAKDFPMEDMNAVLPIMFGGLNKS